MNHTPLKSSTIHSIAHDPAIGALEVKFKDGNTYRYDGVPAVVHQRMLRSESPGSFLRANIDGVYPHKRMP